MTAAQNVALWEAAEAARATSGTVHGDWTATGVSIDSRTVKPGDLFIALSGERHDGHDFLQQAFAKGACAAMVSRIPFGLDPDLPLLMVDDTFEALGDLARVARLRSNARFIGVTGSVGKTGTKEALRLALGSQAPAYATDGNLNNHIGLPLSMARLPKDVFFGIFEMGMNHAGEIAPLSKLVKPDVAIITNVHSVHLENFDDESGIADAKAEIFAGMMPRSTAILNADNPHFARLQAHAKTRGISNILSFGKSKGADAYILDAQMHATCSGVTAVVAGQRLVYSLSMAGEHWVQNSLAVLLAAHAARADLPTAARALSYLRPLQGRGSRSRVATPQGAFTLIDESYNASPVAMRAAFTTLDKTDPAPGGRRIAVLGDMLELGPEAEEMHAALSRDLVQAGIDTVHCAGPLSASLFEALPLHMRGHYAPSSVALAPYVANEVKAGDVVLVKGSAGSRMKAVIEELTALSHEEPVIDINTAIAVNDG